MPLTDTALRSIKPADKAFKKTDGGGLYLLVSPKGSKLWRWDYRYFGIRKTMALGEYPTISLLDARRERDAAKKLLAADIDPMEQKKQAREETAKAVRTTYKVVAEKYIEKMRKDGRAEITIVNVSRQIIDHCGPLHSRPISAIKPAEVLDVLKKIQESGRVETGIEMRASISRVFRFAIASNWAEVDPTSALRGALQTRKPVHLAAITSEDEVGGLVRSIWGYQGWPPLVAMLKIQMLCFARPGETRRMRWDELNLKKAMWTVPSQNVKLRREYDVPLSRQAIAIIEDLRPLTGDQEYVFKSMMHSKTIMSENAMNSALRNMGYTGDRHTSHGFRSTASSLLNESMLFHKDVIETQLDHRDDDEVRQTYNRTAYWKDRIKMMQWWADFLERKAEIKLA
jgi:integrase